MSAQYNTEQINRLNAEKRYEEAKSILRQSSDPGAKRWLENLERQFPLNNTPARSSNWQYGAGNTVSSGTTPYYVSKERGGCLSVWLALLIIVNPLLGFYYLGNARALSSLLHLPSWVLPVLAIFSVINTVCVIGIWLWKKWGVFGFLGASIILFFINLGTLGLGAGTIGGAIGFGLMWYLLSQRWEMFDQSALSCPSLLILFGASSACFWLRLCFRMRIALATNSL